MSISLLPLLGGCRDTPRRTPDMGPDLPPAVTSDTTGWIDLWDAELTLMRSEMEPTAYALARLGAYNQRWAVIQRAVAHHGTAHRDAFYGTRAYWHTGSTRGLGWALDQPDDVNAPVYVDGRGNIRVMGDVNADIEVGGDAVVHVYGDLNARLTLKGVCEVVIAGRISEGASIVCDGQLELFAGGASTGLISASGTTTLILDGDNSGVIQCGAPAASLTVSGDLAADIRAPKEQETILTLRVEGFASSALMLDLVDAGFTRVNGSLGVSDVEPGLYPADNSSTRPKARWVVIRQRDPLDP